MDRRNMITTSKISDTSITTSPITYDAIEVINDVFVPKGTKQLLETNKITWNAVIATYANRGYRKPV